MSQEVAQGWCKEKDIPYFEVSAKNDINVVQAFEMLASRALSRVSGYGGVMCQLPPQDRKRGGFQRRTLGTGRDGGRTGRLVILIRC